MILGIDPGFTGAMCLITEQGIHSIIDIPLLAPEILTARHKFRSLDLPATRAYLDMHAPNIKLAVLERVHAMPKQGVSSTFRFGETTGQLHGLLVGLGINRIVRPSPAVWKSAMAVTHNKKTSLAKAKELAPLHQNLFSLAKHDGRAEAFLLALFGARSLGWAKPHTGNATSDLESIL